MTPNPQEEAVELQPIKSNSNRNHNISSSSDDVKFLESDSQISSEADNLTSQTISNQEENDSLLKKTFNKSIRNEDVVFEEASLKNWITGLCTVRRLQMIALFAIVVWVIIVISVAGYIKKEQVSEQNKLDITKPKTTPILTSTAFSVDGRIEVIPTTIKAFTTAINDEITVSTAYNKDNKDIPTKTESVVAHNTTSKSIISKVSSTETFVTEKESVTQKKIPSDVTEKESVTQKTIPSDVTEKESVTQKNVSIGDIFTTSQKTKEAFDMKKFLSENKHEWNYMVGVGRGDITGPAAEVGMMGYGNMAQKVMGIHTRLYARTFMIGNIKEPNKPFLFVMTDACMGASLLKLEVIKKLNTIYKDKFNTENILLTGTHTHSAPAGYMQDALFQITSKGYVPQTLDAMVEGIVNSIREAHKSYGPGWIFMNKGELLDANINRSPGAYQANPLRERRKYKSNKDTEMTLLKFVDSEGKGIGMLNWFPVHCTSMNNTNTLISSDNKGYAELLFEQAMDPSSLVGKSNFVAAFAQPHEGDISPNTNGPRCIDTGKPCHTSKSSCDGDNTKCIASGPGKDMFESTKIIGNKQYLKAMELYKYASEKLDGDVKFIKQNVNMSDQEVVVKNVTHKTCLPAMGYSFAAGTTDGPGMAGFEQSTLKGNVLWDTLSKFLMEASPEQKKCHHPKPILIDSGEMTKPYEWQPKVVETQVLKIGRLVINAVPAEFTTMAGRRLIKAVRKVLEKEKPKEDFEVIINGLSNTYSDYVTTFEEYQVQRYEGASTIYGPYTLDAYIQQFEKLAVALIKDTPVSPGPEIHNMRDHLLKWSWGVVNDRSGILSNFGELHTDAHDSYTVGDEVYVEFVSAHPRSTYNVTDHTFLTVEKLVDGKWVVVHTDADWCTKFRWARDRDRLFKDTSEANIYWKIPLTTTEGTYKIVHRGHYTRLMTGAYPFEGESKHFKVKQK